MKNKHCPIVALVGRPNVGKSSIFNRLTKNNKAIIDPTPGVTRDRHYEQVTWGDHSFILVDTGGIEIDKPHVARENSEKMISALIREQSWQAIEDADIIIFMLDGREGLVKDDYELANSLRKTQKPLFCLINKLDTIEHEEKQLPLFYELGIEELWPVSAAHGIGVADFLDKLTEHLDIVVQDQESPEDEITLAFIGRPNVGKSSLVNRLLGENRMMVSDIPGTTRDSIDTRLEQDNKKYLFIDTAGIRRKGKVRDKVEKFSVMRALSSMERCDIAIILIDADEGITEQDTKVIGYSVERGTACLVLLNKWDLIKNDRKKQKWLLDEIEMATRFIGYAPTLKISALTGFGVKQIFSSLDMVYKQFSLKFTTGVLNRVLQKAVVTHPPSLYQGKRLKFYYTTQISTKPPTFIIYVNYPKGVHFSYHRFLVNQYRSELKLDHTSLRIFLRERQRKTYG